MFLANVRNVGLGNRVEILGAAVVFELLTAVVVGRTTVEERNPGGFRDDGNRVDEYGCRRRVLPGIVRFEV